MADAASLGARNYDLAFMGKASDCVEGSYTSVVPVLARLEAMGETRLVCSESLSVQFRTYDIVRFIGRLRTCSS